MSVTSFIPNLWEAKIIEEYQAITVADLITTRPSRVEGNKVVFNRAGVTTGLQDYNGTVSYENINTTSVELLLNNKKYFAVKLDDVDAVQVAGELMNPVVRNLAYEFKANADKFVFTKALAGVQEGMKVKPTAAIASAEMAYNLIVDLGTKLDEKSVPVMGRYVIAHPEFVNLLAKDVRVIDNAQVLANGIVQGMEINGMQVIKSPLMEKGKVLCLHPDAIGYALQLDKLEALRLEGSFSDAVRGLQVYGGEVLRKEAISSAEYTLA